MLTQQLWQHCSVQASLSMFALGRGCSVQLYVMSLHVYMPVCTIYSWCLVESDTSVSDAFQEIMEPTVNEWVAFSCGAHRVISSFFTPLGSWWLAQRLRGCYSVWIIEERERKRGGEMCKLTLSEPHPKPALLRNPHSTVPIAGSAIWSLCFSLLDV